MTDGRYSVSEYISGNTTQRNQKNQILKLLLHGLNFSPEEIGIGKYSGEMVQYWIERGHEVTVVTTPPYYPDWKIWTGFSGLRYRSETIRCSTSDHRAASGRLAADERFSNAFKASSSEQVRLLGFAQASDLEPHGTLQIVRCPLWVPTKVTGLKRVIHLASFGLSSIPVVLWMALTMRPDVILTVEPAAMCMPTTWLASRLCGAKAWLHVQDFEVDAAFELGILKQPLLKKMVLAAEAFMMRRFDRVSSISPNMLMRLFKKGVPEDRLVAFPNWVDCHAMRPLDDGQIPSSTPCERRSSFGIPEHKFVAMYSGNIGAKQGLEIIVEAAKRCRNDSIHFVICGQGAAYQALAQTAGELPNVQLLAVQPMEKFNELMNCADVHLLPQRADAADLVMPSKLTGMLATGRPVVACASQGTQISDVVQGHGMVVPPGDAAAFLGAIERLVGDEPMRRQMGAAGRQYAIDHLSRDAILGRFVMDLEALIGCDVSSGST